MVRPVVMVSLLIPTVLALTACCGKTATSTTFGSQTFDVEVPEDEFLAALDDQGDLRADACEDLCRVRVEAQGVDVDTVDGCAPSSAGTTSSTAAPALHSGDSAGDTGLAGVMVACDLTTRNVNQCIGGRDHACIGGEHAGRGATPFAAWLGAQAHAEATSVKSFLAVSAELKRFGAPASLVARARDAARDEVLHARILRTLAATEGGASAPVVFLPAPERDLVAFALENAVEGCVQETWAALVAAFQARHADTAVVRAAFARIASDEARHADLAWAIDAWLMPQLAPDAQRAVQQARQDAVERLLSAVGETDAGLRASAGLPTATQARALLAGLDEALWAPAALAA
jgi:hypothetical protein